MLKIIILLCLLVFEIQATTMECLNGTWTTSGKTKLLYKTPWGNVFKIDPSEQFSLHALPEIHKKNCDCMLCDSKTPDMAGALWFSFLKNNKYNKRFIVIDFKVRTFPAIDNKHTSEFRFQIVRSAKYSPRDTYRDLNGIISIESDSAFFKMRSTYPPPSSKTVIKYKSFYQNGKFRPDFQPASIRIIFDTDTGEHSLLYNGETLAQQLCEKPRNRKRIEIRSIGIITQKFSSNNRNYRDKYWEFSDPVIWQFDNKKQIDQLPNCQFFPYQYEQCHNQKSKNKDKISENNPDYQYHQAMSLIYGNNCNPPLAIKLLKKAARDNHIFANYSLAICYWRGYGVPIDLKKSLEYLDDSARYGYQDAQALQALIRWEYDKRPFFQNSNQSLSALIKKIYPKHDQGIENNLALAAILCSQSCASAIPTPKIIRGQEHWRGVGNKNKGKEYWDFMISHGYFPAYKQKAEQIFQQDSNLAKSYLKKGADAGDLDATLLILWENAITTKGKLLPISPKWELIYADTPIYLFLKFSAQNPDYPGMRDFWDGNITVAKTIWEKQNNPEGFFLTGMSYCLPDSFSLFPDISFRIHNQEILERHFSYWQRAAAGGFQPVMIWLAKRYFYNDLPKNKKNISQTTQTAMALQILSPILDIGNISAELLWVEIVLDTASSNFEQLLKLTDKSCQLQYGPAFFIRGRILERLNKLQDAHQAYAFAAKNGDIRGLQKLALSATSDKFTDTCSKYWKEFIQQDCRIRLLDQYDPYYPNLYSELGQWERQLQLFQLNN